MMSAAFSITARRVLGPVVAHDANALDADSTAFESVLDARRRTFGDEIARQRVPALERPAALGVPTQVVNDQLRLHPGLSVTIDLLLAEVMI